MKYALPMWVLVLFGLSWTAPLPHRNLDKAVEWYKKAAARGSKKA